MECVFLSVPIFYIYFFIKKITFRAPHEQGRPIYLPRHW